jgi:hypothetical protein
MLNVYLICWSIWLSKVNLQSRLVEHGTETEIRCKGVRGYSHTLCYVHANADSRNCPWLHDSIITGECSIVPIGYESGWAPETDWMLWCREKSLTFTENCISATEPTAHHDTDWAILSSGLLRRVALVRTDVSEEPGAILVHECCHWVVYWIWALNIITSDGLLNCQ